MSLVADRPVAGRAMLELAGACSFLDRYEVVIRLPLFSQAGESPDRPAPFNANGPELSAAGHLLMVGCTWR
jgi:hypothetical protein